MATDAMPVRVAELAPLARRRPWDRYIGIVLVGALALAILKPWGGTTADHSVSLSIASAVPAVEAPTPSPAATHRRRLGLISPFGPITLAAKLFVPPSDTCMEDTGWRVCALGADAGQTTVNSFAPEAPLPAGGTDARPTPEPAVVLASTSGAALAFYPPYGFYSAADTAAVAGIGGDPALYLTNAWGEIVVSAWRIEPDAMSRWLELAPVDPLNAGAHVASNVFVPPDQAFLHARTWPDGRYVVELAGGGLAPWEEFFDLQVVSPERTTNTP